MIIYGKVKKRFPFKAKVPCSKLFHLYTFTYYKDRALKFKATHSDCAIYFKYPINNQIQPILNVFVYIRFLYVTETFEELEGTLYLSISGLY